MNWKLTLVLMADFLPGDWLEMVNSTSKKFRRSRAKRFRRDGDVTPRDALRPITAKPGGTQLWRRKKLMRRAFKQGQ